MTSKSDMKKVFKDCSIELTNLYLRLTEDTGIDKDLMLSSQYYALNAILYLLRVYLDKYIRISNHSMLKARIKSLINKAYVIPSIRVFLAEMNPILAYYDIKDAEKIKKQFRVEARKDSELKSSLLNDVSMIINNGKDILIAMQKYTLRDSPKCNPSPKQVRMFTESLSKMKMIERTPIQSKVYKSTSKWRQITADSTSDVKSKTENKEKARFSCIKDLEQMLGK